MRKSTQCLILLAAGCASAPAAAPTPTMAPSPDPSAAIERQTDGVIVRVGEGLLKLSVCANDVIRVAYAKDRAFFDHKTLASQPRQCGGAKFEVSEVPGNVSLATAQLRARVDLGTGRVAFFDSKGAPILEEKGRTLMPAVVQGENTNHIRQEWLPADEALYGLGENQVGLLNLKGYDLDLWQHNGTIVIPFLVSSRGWGIYWDNTSFTRFGDLREFLPIPAERLYDKNGKQGGFTGQYFSGAHFDRLVGERMDRVIDIAIGKTEKK